MATIADLFANDRVRSYSSRIQTCNDFGPCTSIVIVNSMSQVRLAPVMKTQ